VKIEILSIFPEIFSGFLASSLINKATEKSLLAVKLTNFREFAETPHFKVDDTPYGGGAGMVMKPEPLVKAVEDAKTRLPKAHVISLSPKGKKLDQSLAERLSSYPELIILCGRYEGIDERVHDLVVDEEISIGDFILMGGEVAAMALIEATVRLIPGIVGNEESTKTESFSKNLLEAPQYTRPPTFRDLSVPEVLLSGDHKSIDKWRNDAALRLTQELRPDLLKKD